MLVVSILHQNVVGLIPYIGTVAVRAVGSKVGILVDVHSFGGDSLVLVGFVKGFNQLIYVAQFHSGIIFQNLDNGTFLQFACKAGHDLLIQIGGLYIVSGSAVITAARQ